MVDAGLCQVGSVVGVTMGVVIILEKSVVHEKHKTCPEHSRRKHENIQRDT